MEVQKIKIEGIDDLPLVNGGNYFHGIVKREKGCRYGSNLQCCQNENDWKELWQEYGLTAPFSLPKGIHAQCYFSEWESELNETSLLSAEKQENEKDFLHLSWKTTSTLM